MKRLLIALTAGLFFLTACSQGSPAPQTTPSAGASTAASAGKTTVFAAASLKDIFPKIVEGTSSAEAAFSFDGSSGLVDQIKGGAPADVFASADKANMDKLVEAGLVDGDPVMFATNYLVLVVPKGNPGKVTGFDSSLDGVKLVICEKSVPCGAATAKVAEAAGITLKPVSEENNVREVLGKVTSGEADAGLVYVTDAATAGDKVEVIDIPGGKDKPNTYWIAKVAKAPNAAGADAFIDTIMGEAGQKALAEAGFGAPLVGAQQ